MSSSTAAALAAHREQAELGISKQSAIYKFIMTPVILVSFLVSLAYVDFRYTLLRSHNHAQEPSRMPAWLHRLLYRESPYQYVAVRHEEARSAEGHRDARASAGKTGWYYHSKQRGLIKMEVEEAFQIRGTVLVVLSVAAVILGWGVWELGRVGWGAWLAWRTGL